MFVLGLQGSPRRKSNTEVLLSMFLEAAEKRGAETLSVDVCRKNIVPCKELIVCEKKGYCPIDDDMKHEIYPLLRRADVVVAATPIFFYNATAQLKALIDRSQTLWARKYRFNLEDPGDKMRRGFLLAVGATGGKNLFEGLHLTAKYFFDAIAARYDGSLTYRKVEHRGDMENHPTVRQDVEEAVEGLLKPFRGRKKVLFASPENACRSQMAGAYARYLLGEEIEVLCGGTQPAEALNPLMVKAMAEEGIDMAFRKPGTITAALMEGEPDLIVTMDAEEASQGLPATTVKAWHLSGSAGEKIEDLRGVRDEIKEKVMDMMGFQ